MRCENCGHEMSESTIRKMSDEELANRTVESFNKRGIKGFNGGPFTRADLIEHLRKIKKSRITVAKVEG